MNLQLPTNDLKYINPKNLGSRKKIDISYTKDKDENLCIIFHITQKSRVLVKDVDIFEDLYLKAE
ncbi:MAG: hypothetical protein U9Q20_01255, partial [Campylobacterota bacterium]|nr:hypothetical protein [Campylobacterota bacterium]